MWGFEMSDIAIVQNNINALEIDFNNIVENYKGAVDIAFKKEALFAVQLMQNNNFLLKIAIQNPDSLRNAVLNVASIGITLNPSEQYAYLVPRDGRVCLDISYRGLSYIATSGGSIDFVKAMLVYEKDEFIYKGVSVEPSHSFNPFANRGEIVGVYCVAKTCKGDFLTEIMTIEECYEIRERSSAWKTFKSGKTKSCNWETDEGEMLKKTVVKRASKLWPRINLNSTNRLSRAIDVTNEYEGIDFEKERAYEESKKAIEVNYKDKVSIIDNIRALCAQLTRDMNINQKIGFMEQTLKINKFGDLNRMSNDKLNELVEMLRELVNKEKENDETESN